MRYQPTLVAEAELNSKLPASALSVAQAWNDPFNSHVHVADNLHDTSAWFYFHPQWMWLSRL
jgi:hypothetical protein